MSILDSLGSFGSGLISGFTKPETILGTMSLFAQNSAANKAADAVKDKAQADFQNQIELLNLKHQQDMEVLAAKGSGGGDGGAASAALANAELALKRKELAQQRAIAKLSAIQNAKQMEMDSVTQGGSAVQRAIESMLQGATAPLGR